MRVSTLCLPLVTLIVASLGPHVSLGNAVPQGPAVTSQLPGGVPKLAMQYLNTARRWHTDAILVRIDLRKYFAQPGRAPDYNAYSLILNFYSPGAKAFLAYVIGPQGQSFSQPVRLSETAQLNLNFVDLPAAFQAAQEQGIGPRPQSATLHFLSISNNGSTAIWDFHAPGGQRSHVMVLADTGKVVNFGDLCPNCQTGPQVAANETRGMLIPIGLHEVEPVGWYWHARITQRPVYDPWGNFVRWGTNQDYLCWNLVRGQNGLFFLYGRGDRPGMCYMKPGTRFEVESDGGTIRIFGYLTRPDNVVVRQEIGDNWTAHPYNRQECRSKNIDVCP